MTHKLNVPHNAPALALQLARKAIRHPAASFARIPAVQAAGAMQARFIKGGA
jgi:hypothetical protein